MKGNLPYKFDDRERKIVFDRYDLPTPWINYLSNGRMHAFVSQAGGGLAWWLTPQNFRITRYRFYNLPIDSPGFYVYIRTKDGCVWSPTFRPCETSLDKWQAEHSAGKTAFIAQKNGLQAVLTLCMATDCDALIWDLKVKNLTGEDVDFDVFAYVELSQFMHQNEVNLGYYLKWNVQVEYDKELEAITYRYNAWMHPRTSDCPVVYFSSSEEVISYCCDRDLYCGFYRDERNPVQVENGKLNNDNLNGGEPCAALHTHIALKANEEKRMYYFLGVTPGALVDYKKARENTVKTISLLKSNGEVNRQFAKIPKSQFLERAVPADTFARKGS